jgi:hypothetical protein
MKTTNAAWLLFFRRPPAAVSSGGPTRARWLADTVARGLRTRVIPLHRSEIVAQDRVAGPTAAPRNTTLYVYARRRYVTEEPLRSWPVGELADPVRNQAEHPAPCAHGSRKTVQALFRYTSRKSVSRMGEGTGGAVS